MKPHLTLARGLIAALALLALAAIAAPVPAAAHAERPATSVSVTAGPYPLVVALYADPPRAGADLPIVVSPGPGSRVGPRTARVVARPGLGVSATPTRATLAPDPDGPGSLAGAVRLTVTGPWLLEIAVDGPLGEAAAVVPVTAAAPGALPAWVGWLIGVGLPLGGLIWFVIWQQGYLRRLEAVTQP